jgi:DNA-binding transcriptional LysR family regulator
VEPIVLEDIRRLDARPGDVLIVTVPNLTPDAAGEIMAEFKEAFPDVRVFVGETSITVELVRPVAA